MTDNRDLKIVDKRISEPFVPKTETRLIVEDLGDLYPDLNSNYRDISIRYGYGPCSNKDCTCYLEQGFISLYLACPAVNCRGDRQAYQWTHGDCGGPIYINEDAHLKCMTCETSGYITNWCFKCSSHPGEYLETTREDCLEAFSTVIRLYLDKPLRIKQLVRRISDKLMDNSGYPAGTAGLTQPD